MPGDSPLAQLRRDDHTPPYTPRTRKWQEGEITTSSYLPMTQTFSRSLPRRTARRQPEADRFTTKSAHVIRIFTAIGKTGSYGGPTPAGPEPGWRHAEGRETSSKHPAENDRGNRQSSKSVERRCILTLIRAILRVESPMAEILHPP